MNIKRSNFHFLLAITFLVFHVSAIKGLTLSIDANPQRCTLEPKVDETIMWFDESKHKLENPKVKYRVGGTFIYNDELVFVNKRFKTIDIYTFDFEAKSWISSKDSTLFNVIEYLIKDKFLSTGLSAVELVNDTLFVSGICKTQFCSVDIKTMETVYAPEFELPDYHGSEKVAGIAVSHPFVYLAYHSNDYEKDIEYTQRLMCFDLIKNEIVIDQPLNLSENRKDATHGLTKIKDHLWHIKDDQLVMMNSKDGGIEAKYSIAGISRPTSICFHNNSFWIVTYFGGLYEVPTQCN